jgi:hypothetical protein
MPPDLVRWGAAVSMPEGAAAFRALLQSAPDTDTARGNTSAMEQSA